MDALRPPRHETGLGKGVECWAPSHQRVPSSGEPSTAFRASREPFPSRPGHREISQPGLSQNARSALGRPLALLTRHPRRAEPDQQKLWAAP